MSRHVIAPSSLCDGRLHVWVKAVQNHLPRVTRSRLEPSHKPCHHTVYDIVSWHVSNVRYAANDMRARRVAGMHNITCHHQLCKNWMWSYFLLHVAAQSATSATTILSVGSSASLSITLDSLETTSSVVKRFNRIIALLFGVSCHILYRNSDMSILTGYAKYNY